MGFRMKKCLSVLFLFAIQSCTIIPKNKVVYNVDTNILPKLYCSKLDSVSIKDNGNINPEYPLHEGSEKQRKWYNHYSEYFTEKDKSGNVCKDIQKVNLEINVIHSNNYFWFFFHGLSLGIIPYWQDITREVTVQSSALNCSACIKQKSSAEFTFYSSLFLIPILPFREYSLIETTEKINLFQIRELVESKNNIGTKP